MWGWVNTTVEDIEARLDELLDEVVIANVYIFLSMDYSGICFTLYGLLQRHLSSKSLKFVTHVCE